jgi:hypothetical protein
MCRLRPHEQKKQRQGLTVGTMHRMKAPRPAPSWRKCGLTAGDLLQRQGVRVRSVQVSAFDVDVDRDCVPLLHSREALPRGPLAELDCQVCGSEEDVRGHPLPD